MGAYEYSAEFPPAYLSWLESYQLPTDGSADFTDPDGDRLNNWQEWQADTQPNDPASVLKITAVAKDPAGTRVSFVSSASRLYTLYFSADLSGGGWTPVPGATDIIGTGGFQTLTDPVSGSTRFYRVSVRMP